MPNTHLGRRSALALGLAAPFLARTAGAAPLAIPDAIGRSVTLPAAAERIVLLFNYEEFTAIAGVAGWDRVVGYARTQWAVNRSAIFRRYAVPIPRLLGMPDVGNTEENTFSVERVMSLRPDVVIMPEWSFSAARSQVAQLETAGIPVLVIDYNAELPSRHIASTLAIGAITGNAERAKTLAELYAAKLADIAGRLDGVPSRPKVYIEIGRGGPAVIGSTFWTSMWGKLLDRAGVQNIAAGRIPAGEVPMNPEYVLAANPDAIFIAGSSWINAPQAVLTGFDADLPTTRARLAPYAERQGWANLNAIRSGQLFAIEHGLARSLFDYTATYFIAKSVFPDRFADVDPVTELRDYHDRFLPVPLGGTWMARLTPEP